MPSYENRLESLADDRDAWEQQPGETARHFQRFQCYLLAGRIRSVDQVAMQCGIKPATVRHARTMYRWDERVAEWEMAQAVQDGRELRDDARGEVRRQIELLGKLQVKAAEELIGRDWGEFSVLELVRVVDVTSKYSAILTGLPAYGAGTDGTQSLLEQLVPDPQQRQLRLDDLLAEARRRGLTGNGPE